MAARPGGLSAAALSYGPESRYLLECLRDRHDDALRFVFDLDVWPTNNLPERDLRPFTTQQKIQWAAHLHHRGHLPPEGRQLPVHRPQARVSALHCDSRSAAPPGCHRPPSSPPDGHPIVIPPCRSRPAWPAGMPTTRHLQQDL
ncbi:transposase [Frankia sp. CiP3]|uniref:IS66 family transposase n=1 Tax=Frankia sp. CiP3 TaxID=2880971 RepID=UPI001EF65902|nr:transposase [Frankia sp. CiP3]